MSLHHADGGHEHRKILAAGLSTHGGLKKSQPIVVTDRDLNQVSPTSLRIITYAFKYHEEMNEHGHYVKRKIGNKKKDGNMSTSEAAYFIDSKACKVSELN